MPKILDYLQIRKLVRKKSWIHLDRISIVNENQAIGLKNISIAEDYFNGHFPNQKIMPGVLQLELMIETATILKLHNDKEKSFYELSSMKKIRFKKPIFPGSQVLFEIDFIEQVNDDTSFFKAKSIVDNQICAFAEFSIKRIDMADLTRDFFEKNITYNEKEEDKVAISVEETFKDIPHRSPFLFVEKLNYFNEKEMLAEKYVTNNDPYMTEFIDEGNLYLPTPYLFEIGAQYYLSVTNMLKENILQRTTPLFVSIEDAEVHRIVLPGEVLSFHLKVIFFKVGIAKASMSIQANGENVADASISCAFIEK